MLCQATAQERPGIVKPKGMEDRDENKNKNKHRSPNKKYHIFFAQKKKVSFM